MVNLFRITAFLEGVSLLLLLFIAMPLKYIWDSPFLVQKVGMAHGILFIAYIVIAFLIKNDLKWSNKTLLFVCIASIIPFGTFVIEKKLKKGISY
ncbi:DUF3817 domain-containing protein [Myroides odoratus]|uniref:DUF3817 domain-containing protein n=1 Tax=Myroides odoratus TaxID=256 RepID=UPI0039B0FE57